MTNGRYQLNKLEVSTRLFCRLNAEYVIKYRIPKEKVFTYNSLLYRYQVPLTSKSEGFRNGVTDQKLLY